MEDQIRERRALPNDVAILREGRRFVGDLPKRIDRWQEQAAFLNGRRLCRIVRKRDLSGLQQEAELLAEAIRSELAAFERRLEDVPPRVRASSPVGNVRRSLDGLLRRLDQIAAPVERRSSKG